MPLYVFVPLQHGHLHFPVLLQESIRSYTRKFSLSDIRPFQNAEWKEVHISDPGAVLDALGICNR